MKYVGMILTCAVYDFLLPEMAQEVLGAFCVGLCSYYVWSKASL